MREQDVFILADTTLQKVVDQISDEQWAMVMPSTFAMQHRDHDVTLREIINYHAYDDAWVPDMLAGRTMDEAGKDNFQGDLLGDDPKASFGAIVDKACASARELDPERMVHCSFGDFPAREYFWQINGFRGLRAHDIAQVIGVDTTLPSDLVEALWAEIEPHAEEWRAIGVFRAKVDVPAGASLQDRLLGLTGRQPDSAA